MYPIYFHGTRILLCTFHLLSYLSLEGAVYEKFSCSHLLVLYTFASCIYKVKTLNRFANFFAQSTDTQTIMHFQLTHFIS